MRVNNLENQDNYSKREQTRSCCRFQPRVDISESAEEILLKADMPGVLAEDISLDYNNGVLSVYGKVQPRQHDGTDFLLREYKVGDFYRAFEINEGIQADKISAACAEGVLTVHLPKTEMVKARRIQVNAN